MPRFFDVTAPTYSVSLDADRRGQVPFTVTNASGASVRGDAVVVVAQGMERDWFVVERPSRHFAVGATEQFTVAIAIPPDAPAGAYQFRLRMLLGGGVPEEQYDDSEAVRFAVEAPPVEPPPPPPPPPPKPAIPWWMIALGVLAVVVVLGVVAFLLWPRPPTTTATVIDFEAPALGGANAQITNPLVVSGVVFSTNQPGVVGLVKNRATSACADPADDNQKLGTGVGVDPASVGRAAFPLRAQFSPPLAAGATPAKVSVEYQSGVGATVRLRLLDAANNVIAETTGAITVAQGSCGFPGGPRGRTTLSLQASQPVALAVLDELSGGRVFVVDSFTFEAGR